MIKFFTLSFIEIGIKGKSKIKCMILIIAQASCADFPLSNELKNPKQTPVPVAI